MHETTKGTRHQAFEAITFAISHGIPQTIGFIHAILKMGLINDDEANGFVSEHLRLGARAADSPPSAFASFETCTCEGCDVAAPARMLTSVGDGALVLCQRCLNRNCGSMPNDAVERGWDGRGDFEDMPAFMRGMPVELD